MVLMEASSQGINSKPEVIDYCVNPLARILSSENDAQMYIYHASCDSPFGFCCDFDEDTSGEVARLSEVLSVRHDPDYIAVKETYSSLTGSTVSCGEYQPLACSNGQAGGWRCYEGTNG